MKSLLRSARVLTALALLAGAWVVSCSRHSGRPSGVGAVEVALAEIPTDASCLRLTASAGAFTTSSDFTLVRGQRLVATLEDLPTGFVFIDADAFVPDCSALTPSSVPNWVSSGVTV